MCVSAAVARYLLVSRAAERWGVTIRKPTAGSGSASKGLGTFKDEEIAGPKRTNDACCKNGFDAPIYVVGNMLS